MSLLRVKKTVKREERGEEKRGEEKRGYNTNNKRGLTGAGGVAHLHHECLNDAVDYGVIVVPLHAQLDEIATCDYSTFMWNNIEKEEDREIRVKYFRKSN